MLNRTLQTTKTSETYLKKAQKLRFLCLFFVAVFSFAGIVGGKQACAQTPIYATGNSNVAAQMEIRAQQMETQIRNLTGKVERQAYEIKQLKRDVESLQSLKLGSVGGPVYHEPAFGSPQPIGNDVVNSGDLKFKTATAKIDKPAPSKPKNTILNFEPPSSLGIKTSVPGGAEAGATAMYEQAYAHLKSAQYDDARERFQGFLDNYPNHVLAANAKYWLGETYYVQGHYKKSAKAFAEGFQKFPKSAKSPDILLKLGMSLAKLGKEKDACVALGQLAVKFPTETNPAKKRAEQEMSNLGCK